MMTKMKLLILLPVMIFTLQLCAQDENDCAVNLEGLSEVYVGDCRKNLANGIGAAEGSLGQYIGSFKKGFPDGKGKITYLDGSSYEGMWNRGDREGEGNMFFPSDSILTGFWENDVYLGLYKNAYEIVQSRGPARYQLTKTSDGQNKVEVKFFRGGLENPTALSNIRLSAPSGTLYQTPGYLGFEQLQFPVEVTLNYMAPNSLNTQMHQEYIRIQINEPGGWLIRANY
ncbi:MAG: hypothetical protein ACI8QD_002077 [Cyclobacteriaceae bacterium]|jgi:hypothetical protein